MKWSELRLWNGGKRPVGPDKQVQVIHRDFVIGGQCTARILEWEHTGEGSDIIAYRVEVKPARPLELWVNYYGGNPAHCYVYDSKGLAESKLAYKGRTVRMREVLE